jgi:hypothetical protein
LPRVSPVSDRSRRPARGDPSSRPRRLVLLATLVTVRQGSADGTARGGPEFTPSRRFYPSDGVHEAFRQHVWHVEHRHRSPRLGRFKRSRCGVHRGKRPATSSTSGARAIGSERRSKPGSSASAWSPARPPARPTRTPPHPPAWGWVSFQPAQVGHEYAGVDKVRETCVGRGSERSNGCSRPDVRQRPLSALESP